MGEHARFVARLREFGVNVMLVESHDQKIPDACFPNNWISTHSELETGVNTWKLIYVVLTSKANLP